MTQETAPKLEEIVVPPEVIELFDQADADGQYAALICPDSVKLTSRDGQKVFKTVMWPQAFIWARNAMSIISKNVPA